MKCFGVLQILACAGCWIRDVTEFGFYSKEMVKCLQSGREMSVETLRDIKNCKVQHCILFS